MDSDAPHELSALQLMAGRYALLCDMALTLTRVEDAEKLADLVLEKISSILDFERCTVALYRPETDTYDIRTQSERRTDVELVENFEISSSVGLAGRCIRRERPVYVPVVSDGGEGSLGIADVGMEGGSLRSVLSLPLFSTERCIGALMLGAERPNAFTPGDIQVARQVSSCLAVAVERQRRREAADLLDERLEKKRLHLEETVERLEKTNLELDTFIYAASHDLRAPLLSISGLVDLASTAIDGNEVEQVRDILGRVQRNIKRLDTLVVDILQVNRARRFEHVVEPTDVSALIREALESLEGMDHSNAVELRVDCSIGDAINVERQRLLQVVHNLVSNGVKYADWDSEDRWVSVSAWTEDDELHLTVSDNGIGIPDDLHERVFDLFYRATSQSFGSGLGLFLVRRHCESMGGSICASTVDGNTQFYVKVPIQ